MGVSVIGESFCILYYCNIYNKICDAFVFGPFHFMSLEYYYYYYY